MLYLFIVFFTETVSQHCLLLIHHMDFYILLCLYLNCTIMVCGGECVVTFV